MILAWLLLLTGLTISAVAIYYSVVGLAAIFSAAVIPIYIMGSSLEVAKLVCASWLKANWERAPLLMKTYMTTAVTVLMIITSMGIFGFLSKAHSDQSLVSGDVLSKIAVYDEQINTEKSNIESAKKALTQMDAQVDQMLGRTDSDKGAERAVSIRKQQAKERANLQAEITKAQKNISALQAQRAPIAAEVRKVEAEVGPIKYIAKFIYGDHGADENMLERAVTWIIILIVIVFDPLAVIMLLAAQMTFQWHKEEKEKQQTLATSTTDEPGPIERTVFEPKDRTVDPKDDDLAAMSIVPPEELPVSYVMGRPWTEEEVAALARSTDSEPVENKDNDVLNGPDLYIGDTPVDQWNKMIAAAEKEAAEEAAKWAEENKEEPEAQEAKDWAEEVVTTPPADFPEDEESKKKDQLHDQIARTINNQGEEVGYVQNGEQGEGTLWARIQQRAQSRSKDELYVLYGKNKFADITVDATIDPELAKFVEETKSKGPKFSNYSNEKLHSFVERIYELRKNQSNNAAG
jgi:hypothetical protein